MDVSSWLEETSPDLLRGDGARLGVVLLVEFEHRARILGGDADPEVVSMCVQVRCQRGDGRWDCARLTAGAEQGDLRGGGDEEREYLVAVDRDRVVGNVTGTGLGEHDLLGRIAAEQPAGPEPKQIPDANL